MKIKLLSAFLGMIILSGCSLKEEVKEVKKTVCELFAGVGGFRCGLNNIKTSKDYGKKEK